MASLPTEAMQARLAALQGQLGHLSGMDGAPQPGGGP